MKDLMQPKEKWGPLHADDRKGTVYERKYILAEEDPSLWEYDFRGVLHRDHTIVLARTPAGGKN